MKVLREYIKVLLTEQEVKFSGILKLSPSSEVLDTVRSLLAKLPPEAIALPDDKFHVTLIHQSILKPFKKQMKQMSKEGTLPQPPEVILNDQVEERVDDSLGRRSWVAWVQNQEEMRAYVNQVMELVGGQLNPEPGRRFHISIANLTGNAADSVK